MFIPPVEFQRLEKSLPRSTEVVLEAHGGQTPYQNLLCVFTFHLSPIHICNQINGSLPSKKRTYFMGQICSAVQGRDGFALFVVLQLFVDLKGQIVFISKRER